MTKQFYAAPDRNKAKYIYKLCRPELSRIVQLITGHGKLAYFQSKLQPNLDPTCRLCFETNETFWYLLYECPALLQQRSEILHEYNPDGELRDWSVQKLLDFSHMHKVEEAVDRIYLIDNTEDESEDSQLSIGST
jgi:hypothetical protein